MVIAPIMIDGLVQTPFKKRYCWKYVHRAIADLVVRSLSYGLTTEPQLIIASPPDLSLMLRVKSRSNIEIKVNPMAVRQRRYPKEELADRGQAHDTTNLH